MKDLKYLAAFSIPLVAFLSVYIKGPLVFATPIFAFIILPILELILPINDANLSEEDSQNKFKNSLFDWLLYLNLPIVFGLIIYALNEVTSHQFQTLEIIDLILSVGLVLSVNGINVGHELGHRQASKQRFIGKALLMPSLYMHFYIEHNFGHHINAATPEDPATARYNQSVYSFWFTSAIRQYFSAWEIQTRLLKNYNLKFFSLRNDMLWYIIIQSLYLSVVYYLFGVLGLLFAIGSAIVAVLLLESINYVEHYGLRRLKTKSGRYERVKEIHSWNSNHVLGRIVLYELTRHSDHHYISSKKYQVLNCHEDSPQLPYGYPTSILISLCPPLWFYIMNKRVPKDMIVY